MDADKGKPPTGIVSRLRVVFARDSRRASASPSPNAPAKRRTSRSAAAPVTQTPPPRAAEPEVATAAVSTVESDVQTPEEAHAHNDSPVTTTTTTTTAHEPVSDAAVAGNQTETRQPYPLLDTFAARGPDEIAVISFNMLADHNLSLSAANPNDGRYRHALGATPWAVRKPSLLDELRTLCASADVVALQEADYFPFHDDVLPALRDVGFDGMHQWDGALKENRPPHPWGTAILFRRDVFAVGFKETRSRGMVLGLCREGHTTPDYFIVNVHLEGNSENVEKQLKQLHSTIYKMSTHASVDPATARVLVCGDFNSKANDAPLTWLVNGSLPGPKPVVTAHAFRFQSALDVAGFNPVTYADPYCAERVDHVAFTADTMELRSVFKTRAHSSGPVFSATFPSDHLPVGACFRDKPVTPAPARPVASDPDACPLTEGQLRVFLFLMQGAPVKSNKKGKPSAAKLAAIRAHQDQLDNFASHLSPAAKEWVEGWKRREKKKKTATTASDEPKQESDKRSTTDPAHDVIVNRPSRSASVKLMQALPIEAAIDDAGESRKAKSMRRMTFVDRLSSAGF